MYKSDTSATHNNVGISAKRGSKTSLENVLQNSMIASQSHKTNEPWSELPTSLTSQ